MIRKVIVDPSQRLQLIGPTSLVELERVKRRLVARGEPIIDLGRFDPDLAVDPELVAVMQRALAEPDALRLGRRELAEQFKEEAARWFARRFGVKLRPRTMILPTAGIKQAVYFLAEALINPGDKVGVPDPSYPLYRAAAVYAGGEAVKVELRSTNDFLPNLAKLEGRNSRPKILFLNYPHNPTSTPPDRAFFADLVRWARRNNVIVIQDFAYGEIYYENEPPVSLLSIPGGRLVAVELHSFSFTYNLAGLKLGFAAGNPDVLAALEQAIWSLTSGINNFYLTVGIEALRAYDRVSSANNAEYTVRRKAMADGLEQMGWSFRKPTAGPFFWVSVPGRSNDERLARRLLGRARVLVAPGSAFGEGGEGYLRFSVARNVETIREAFDRIGKLLPHRLKRMRESWGSSGSNG
jgi:aspartate/methionine/tyrosine aminotransferase